MNKSRSLVIVILAASFLAASTAQSVAVTLFHIRGLVEDNVARPLVGVAVTDHTQTVTTGSDGRYDLPESSTGNYTLTATGSNVNSLSQSTYVPTPTDQTLDFTPASNYALTYKLTSLMTRQYISTVSGSASVTLTITSFAPNGGSSGSGSSCVYVTDSRTGTTDLAQYVSTDSSSGASTWSKTLQFVQSSLEGSYSLVSAAKDCQSGALLTVNPSPSLQYIIDNTPPAIDVNSLTPLNAGNTVFTSQRLLAKLSDTLSGVDPSTVVFSVAGLGSLPSSWNSSTGWAKTINALSLTLGQSYTATVQLQDRAGNSASYTWTFRAITLPVSTTTGKMSGTSVDSGSAGTAPGTEHWTINPVVDLPGRQVYLQYGSQHSGWGTVSSDIPLGSARVHYTLNGTSQVATTNPYASGAVQHFYQQLVLLGSLSAGRPMTIAQDQAQLTPIGVDLPIGAQSVSIQFDPPQTCYLFGCWGVDPNAVDVPASPVDVCSEPDSGPEMCAPDPFRFYEDEKWSQKSSAKLPVYEPPPYLGILQLTPDTDPLNPDPGGVWRSIGPLASTPECGPGQYSQPCLYNGVIYPPLAMVVPPDGLKTFCSAVLVCSSEAKQSTQDHKYDCIDQRTGDDIANLQKNQYCQQDYYLDAYLLNTEAPRTHPGNLLRQFQTVLSLNWGYDEDLKDSLGMHFWEPGDHQARFAFARTDDLPTWATSVTEASNGFGQEDVYPQFGDWATNAAWDVASACYPPRGTQAPPQMRVIPPDPTNNNTTVYGVGTGSAPEDVSSTNQGGFPQHWHWTGEDHVSYVNCYPTVDDGNLTHVGVRITDGLLVAWIQPIDNGNITDGGIKGTWGHLYKTWSTHWDLLKIAEKGAACALGSIWESCSPFGITYTTESDKTEWHEVTHGAAW